MRKGSRIFLQNAHFSANSNKTCYEIRFFNNLWIFTNPLLKKTPRREKSSYDVDIFFSFDICIYQPKK